MKESNYNFFYKLDDENDKIIAYNSRTNGMALMDENQYKAFNDYIRLGVAIEDEEFFSGLQKGGYLVDDEINELEMLKLKLLKSKFSTKRLGLTIAPTLNCNFDCIYCYEKDYRQNSVMSQETQDKIVEMVKKNVPFIGSLDVTWYGGEPLLETKILEDLSKKFIEICKESKIEYSAKIITNGYRLTAELAKTLKSLNINSVQVTLDGPPEVHNARRPLVGGQPTFHEILKRVGECADLIDIALRVNIDKENKEKIREVLDIIENAGLKNKVFVYLGYVEPTNNCYQVNTCMNYNDFSNLDYDFHDILKEKGFETEAWSKYPQPKAGYCGADSINTYVIDPKGDIYKCWTDMGIKKYSIGNLYDNKNNIGTRFETLSTYLLYDPTVDNECNECKVLPVCMGGCPRRRRDKVVDRCSEYKYTLDKYLKNLARAKYKHLLTDEL